MMEQQFRETVWQTIAAIPPGKVATYGQIASLCGYPGHARGVGHILKNLPPETLLPWHRVINAKGEIALPTGSESQQLQRQRLEWECQRSHAGNLITYAFKSLGIVCKVLCWPLWPIPSGVFSRYFSAI
jgi:methylated-DNA-protein-cysteine methyltransferase-like protein